MIPNSPDAWSARAAAPTSHDAALWSARGQHDRFTAVLRALEPEPGEALLDFGCGTGALSAFLPEDVTYVGYDWSAGMLARARRDHPAAAFVDEPPQDAFDLVACVGTFNLPDHWSKDATWDKIRELWTITARALAVCLYAGTDPKCLRYSEEELEALDMPEVAARQIERDRPNDLLLVLHRL